MVKKLSLDKEALRARGRTVVGRRLVTANELIEVGEAENGDRIELRLHQKLRITLPETRTAGFRSNLRSPNECFFSLLEDEIQTPLAAVGGTALITGCCGPKRPE